jgi:nucleotide-binding universal stress UspA family protein
MKTIVVGYDGTEPSDRALERAADLGEAFGAKLVVTSVAPIMISTSRSMGPIDPVDTPEEHHEELVKAQKYLSGRKVSAEYQPAIGDPADTIVEAADTVGADLIVVGTREPGLVQRLLGQSVSESVQRHAHCDVLIVHAH